jgi:hypothetical protein
MPSTLDDFKPLIAQWPAATPGLLATRENDGLNWPHCDGLNWPHLRPIVA